MEKNEEDKIVSIKMKRLNDKNDAHYHFILDEYMGNYVSVGTTTDKKKGKSKKAGNNYPLKIDPLSKGEKAYMRRQGMVAKKVRYRGSYKGKITEIDYERAKLYAEIAKQKYILKQKKKSNKKCNGIPTH